MDEASLPSIPAVVAPFSTELGAEPDGRTAPVAELPYYVAEAVLGRLSWDIVAVIVENSHLHLGDWGDAVGDYWLTGTTGPMVTRAGLATENAIVDAARIVSRSLVARYRDGQITAFTCLWSIARLDGLLPELEDVSILWEAWAGADEVQTNPALEVDARREISELLGRLETWSAE